MTRCALAIPGFLAILAANVPNAHGQHAGDLWVGVSSNGQLVLGPQGYAPQESYTTLPPGGVFFPGWADSNPGWDHVSSANPAADVYPLGAGVNVHLEIVEFDPAFRIVILGNPPLFLDQPGQTTELGGSTLHEHIPYHINSSDAAYDPDQCVWHATLVLFDSGATGYSDSAPFTFSFTNVTWGPGVQPVPILADGDFDNNAIVDDADVAAFAECMSGPDARPSPADPAITLCEVDCVNAFDFDVDLDVDLEDYAELQLRP